ncbi:MAG: hypothetical protein MJ231_00310 [bacterium]|nr:hypothetical protein [bacterium]
MISSVGQNNNVQRFSAVNALRSSASQLKPHSSEASTPEDLSTRVAPKGLLERINVNEVRECAKAVGEYNITDEEIKYGMMYGRSVIAEFLA